MKKEYFVAALCAACLSGCAATADFLAETTAGVVGTSDSGESSEPSPRQQQARTSQREVSPAVAARKARVEERNKLLAEQRKEKETEGFRNSLNDVRGEIEITLLPSGKTEIIAWEAMYNITKSDVNFFIPLESEIADFKFNAQRIAYDCGGGTIDVREVPEHNYSRTKVRKYSDTSTRATGKVYRLFEDVCYQAQGYGRIEGLSYDN